MQEQKRMIRFLLYALGMVIGWFFLYDIWFSAFDEWLNIRIAEASAGVLGLGGYKATTASSTIFIDGQQVVYVGTPCNGMVLMALFTGFIVAFPGPALQKLYYIPSGILLINLINVLRVTLLALNAHYSQETLNFNHKYTFTVVVYGCIFALWMLWVKKFSQLNNHETPVVPY